MSDLSTQPSRPTYLDDVIDEARGTIPELVDRVVTDIRAHVPAYAGKEHGERHKIIATAVTAAAHQFLDSIRGPIDPDPKAFQLFRDMGYGEAQDGNTLDPMRRALRIANRHSWRLIHTMATAHDLDTTFLGQLGDALFAYIDHLDQEVTRGYEVGLSQPAPGDDPLRERLLEVLLDGSLDPEARPHAIEAEAMSAGWSVPDEVVVMRVSYHGQFPEFRPKDSVLVDTKRNPAVMVAAATGAAAVAEGVTRQGPGIRVAMSWPVPPAEAAAADGWARRTLNLVAAQIIEPQHVVRCADHITELWLHAEPLLRRTLVLELLPPLLNETPNSREILSETMLAWLESRDSAPAIAARLDVHPQTVRYRWKRINELFGELLHDPQFVLTVTMVLKATVPLWKAGDTSDLTRYLERSGAQ